MEEEAKESYEEKENLENDEIPPDTEINNKEKETEKKDEEVVENQEIIKEEKNEINEKKMEKNEENDEQKIEEKNENEENDDKEKLHDENEDIQENSEIPEDENNNDNMEDNHEEGENEENYEEENKENKENADINEHEHENEEIEENQEENESQENNEEEDIQPNNQQDEEHEEYKERQAIHIHKENEEKEEKNEEEEKEENEENEENEEHINNEDNDNMEERGKIHPVENNEKNIHQEEMHKIIEEENEHSHAEEENIEYINHEVEEIEEENDNENEEQNEHKQNEISYEEEQSQDLEKPQIKSEIQPLDSKHKINETNSQKIQIKQKISKKNEIPRIMIFEKLIDYSVDDDDSHLHKSEMGSPIDISNTETQKYSKKEVAVMRAHGIEKGEYKFLGSQQHFVQDEPFYANAKISKEEIMTEINRRSQKRKKISYKVIDKYYSLTVYKNNNVEINKNEIKENANAEIPKGILPEDNYSKYLLEQINKIRAEPQSFIGVIEDAKDNIKKSRHGKYYYSSNQTKVGLKEGESAFNQAIEFLKTLQPMNPLAFTQSLIPTPPKNEEEIHDINYLRKNVVEMMKNGFNVKSYWRDFINDPEICFLLMIVDDNGAKKGLRRNDILNPNMKYIGISSFKINENYVNYFVLSS
jgi:hypothetical protein